MIKSSGESGADEAIQRICGEQRPHVRSGSRETDTNVRKSDFGGTKIGDEDFVRAIRCDVMQLRTERLALLGQGERHSDHRNGELKGEEGPPSITGEGGAPL